jgi:GT2 family glycosyltransferase
MPGSGESPQAEIIVSVVIPTHDRHALLERLLASLERQTLDPARFETIIVHNYTPDGTEEMARRWCERHGDRAQYHRRDFKGPARSRDLGARTARGRYIAFIDDDCVATPGWLEAGLAAFAAAGASGPVPSPPHSARTLGLVQGRTLPMPGQPHPFVSKTINIDAPTCYFETCNIFYPKEVFLAVGGFSHDLLDWFSGEDTDLGWKVVEHGYATGFAPAALVNHEIFRVSISKWLVAPLIFRNLPRLVRLHPRMRQHLYHRWFLSRDSCLFNAFLLALVLLPFFPLAAAAVALPYLFVRYAGGGHVGGPLPRIARILAGIPRAAVTWWALANASIRARTLVL